ncbi:MAG: toxin-antitoxin system HicB family antitoxin [Ruminococcaceae bacterium]|nr:toxin-antitoxin system HicB family antitoxin [Oscillospiraceae bacterium]
MKDLNYYLSLPYRLEIVPDSDEGGYAARYPELPGCITCADTMDKLVANAEDAKRAWLESALEEGLAIAEPARDEDYSGQFKLRLPKSLHRALAEHSRAEGISMNQYCLYLLSKYDSAPSAR